LIFNKFVYLIIKFLFSVIFIIREHDIIFKIFIKAFILIISRFSLSTVLISYFSFIGLIFKNFSKNLIPIDPFTHQIYNFIDFSLLIDDPLLDVDLFNDKALVISTTGIGVDAVLVFTLVIFDALLVPANEEPALGCYGARMQGRTAFRGVVPVGVRPKNVKGAGRAGGP
jgi:hypothetical protein